MLGSKIGIILIGSSLLLLALLTIIGFKIFRPRTPRRYRPYPKD